MWIWTRKKVRRWTHKILWTQEILVNAWKFGHEHRENGWMYDSCWTHESLDINAQKSGKRAKVWHKITKACEELESLVERTKVKWTPESMDMNALQSGERNLVWTGKLKILVHSRKSRNKIFVSGMDCT